MHGWYNRDRSGRKLKREDRLKKKIVGKKELVREKGGERT